MAALASSAVTFTDSWLDKGPNRTTIVRVLTLVLTGQGSVANPINASTLDLGIIDAATPAVASDNSLVIVASPSYDGSLLLLKAAGTNAPADYTATVRLTVRGRK